MRTAVCQPRFYDAWSTCPTTDTNVNIACSPLWIWNTAGSIEWRVWPAAWDRVKRRTVLFGNGTRAQVEIAVCEASIHAGWGDEVNVRYIFTN
jgi:hypothetical protein